MERIKLPLRDLLAKLRLADPMTGWQAVELWPEAVGERIAAHARAAAFRDGTLVVEVDSTAWMNELTYLERRIRNRLNRRIGRNAVQVIRLRPAAGTTHQPRKRNRT